MCFSPSIPADNSAEIARKQEQERQDRIDAGRSRIDETFAKFDDPYFKQVEDNYTGYYMPQLEDQYQEARRKKVLGLSRSGNLNSGSGARQLSDLFGAYEDNRSLVGNSALDAANRARSDVEGSRSDLYSQNRSAADPSAAQSSALARAGTLTPPQSYSPLGDMFSKFIDNGATAVQAERAGYNGWNTGLFNSGTGGSSRVVR